MEMHGWNPSFDLMGSTAAGDGTVDLAGLLAAAAILSNAGETNTKVGSIRNIIGSDSIHDKGGGLNVVEILAGCADFNSHVVGRLRERRSATVRQLAV